MSPRRFLPGLLLLFVGSGCAALIYEIVWFQLLQLVIGSSSISLGILLGTFMGGMCVGSLLLPRVISPRRHPLRVYALLELGIGAFGLLILVSMPLVGGVYTTWAGEGTAGIVFRAVIAGICLLPPTMLMGATLPAISRWVKTTPEGVAWLGFFYGGNIGGGVVGSLAAGFYLLRVFDVATATLAAVAINILVFAIAMALARQTPYEADAPPPADVRAAGAWPVYTAIALSGTTALAAEVIWTRLLSLHFGATVYTFALILAVFLIGLGIGSTAGANLARTSPSPRRALGWCQLLVCAALAWAAYQLTESLPYWPINPSIATTPWFTMQLDFVRCLWVVLPGAILWGASFPLALAAVATTEQDAARLAGGVYAANTVGAIAGSLVTSFVLIPWIGTSHSEQVIIIVAALSALLMLEPSFSTRAAPCAPSAPSTVSAASAISAFSGTVVLAIAMIASGMLARSIHPLPGLLVAYGRYSATRVGQADVIYVGEGLNAFDAVTSQPLGPWVKGAAMLYTAEFFDLVKKHLNPGGVVTLFVQLYESNTEAVKSEIGTFLEAFPNGVVFGNTNEGKGYDLVLLGQVEPTRIDVDAVQARLQRPEYAPVQQSLREIGMNSAVDLFATYAGRRPDLEPWLKTAQINHDRNLRLQYLAGLGLNLYQADVIYAEMLRYVTKTPDDLFVASDATKQRLFAAIQSAQGRPQ